MGHDLGNVTLVIYIRVWIDMGHDLGNVTLVIYMRLNRYGPQSGKCYTGYNIRV